MVTATQADAAVRKSVTVNAGIDRAFRVFTDGIDTWWPRTHHIGAGTLKQIVVEPRVHGRCYGRNTEGEEADWGTVLAWEPPHRFVLAWQITPDWKCEPDLARASEVEVRFTAEGQARTRVDLEHRYFHRHGAGGATIRQSVDSEGGWGLLLQLYAGRVTTIAPVALIFGLNDGLLTRAFDGLSDEELSRRVTEHNNSILWIAAHAVHTRTSLLKMLGDSYDTGWGARFARGAAFDAEATPSREQLLQVHGEVSRRVQARLAALDDQQLAAPITVPAPPGVKTVSDMIAFIALHESYHVGQMAFARKALGHSALVG